MTSDGVGVLGPAEALIAVDGLRGIIADEASKADRAAAFPERSIAALRDAGLMSAAIPRAYGGHNFGALDLSEIAMRLGRLCGSTAMIWAMHQIQVACMLNSAERQPELADYLRRAAREQHLIASVTSEEGSGDIRSSKTAAVPVAGGVEITKRAPTVSYAEAADSFLVTARRDPAAAQGDQVLILVEALQVGLRRTGEWDTLGMRATCSAPQEITALVDAWQVLDEPFAQIASTCMVPVSHILWSSVWSGIADDAVQKAVTFARTKLQGSTSAPSSRLGWMHARSQTLKDSIRQFAADYSRDPGGHRVTVSANALKMQVSVDTVRIAEMALDICGMAGYSEVGRFSVCRNLRDLYSARVMISNEKLSAVNSELVTFGDNHY